MTIKWPKHDQNMTKKWSKMTDQLSKNDHKMTKKWPENNPKMIKKWPKNCQKYNKPRFKIDLSNKNWSKERFECRKMRNNVIFYQIVVILAKMVKNSPKMIEKSTKKVNKNILYALYCMIDRVWEA